MRRRVVLAAVLVVAAALTVPMKVQRVPVVHVKEVE